MSGAGLQGRVTTPEPETHTSAPASRSGRFLLGGSRTLDEHIQAVVTRAVTAAIRAERREDTDPDSGELLVSCAEAGRRLGVQGDTVRQMVALGDLDAVHGIGRGMKVTVASLRRWGDEHTTNSITVPR